METIFAVSSGNPPAAIAVIRITGPDAARAAERLAGPLPAPRTASLRRLRDGELLLDQGLVILFPGPASATGEDLVELHCHGGRAVVAAVMDALDRDPALRRAEGGEFTRRALTNGRIDLTETEGLADLLAAETEGQRVAALRSAEGQVSRLVAGWVERVAMLSARVEAMLDFADEDDVAAGGDDGAGIAAAMRELGDDMEEVLAAPPVDRLRDGIRVVIGGPPNSGKSTLFNQLVQRDAAIVSPIAGTTRDRIEANVSRDGLPFVISDTAGLAEQTEDEIEAIGIARARDALAAADLLLWLGDMPPPRPDALWVHSRADLPGRETIPSGPVLAVRHDRPVSIDRLWVLLADRGRRLVPRPDQLSLHKRQRRLCGEARDNLLTVWSDPLIAAELLRGARVLLAQITGENATEDMLDALFGRFCIGK